MSVATRSVESSSLFHHSNYPWFNCFPWWSIDELENLHADRTTNYMFWAITEAEGEVGYPRKTGLSPQYFNTDRSKAVLLLWFLTVTCSCCTYLYFDSPIIWVTYLGSWMTTCLGKSCSFGLPRVPFVICCQFMYLVISLLLSRAGYETWFYQFLIIAYCFTLSYAVIYKIQRFNKYRHLIDKKLDIDCTEPYRLELNRLELCSNNLFIYSLVFIY